MLSKSALLKLLVDVASVGDVTVLDEDRNLPLEVCAAEDRGVVRRLATMVASLMQDYDYQKSPEFQESVAGKSGAFVAMKNRLLSDPVKRSEQRRRIEAALGGLLSRDEAYLLLPIEQHPALRDLVELVGQLRNPAD